MSVIQQDDFIQFVKENKSGMYRFAFSILKNDVDAEDAVSEAIIKGYENLSKLRDKEKLKVWMMSILSNEAKKIYKKEKCYILEDALPEYAITEEKDYELWDVVKSLPQNFSKVIILYYYEGFSTKEIAQILKIAEGTVKSRLSRGRDQIKDMLEL